MTAEAPKGPGRTRRKVPTPRTAEAPDGNEPQSPVTRTPAGSPDEAIGSAAADRLLRRVLPGSNVDRLLRRLSNEDSQSDQS